MPPLPKGFDTEGFGRFWAAVRPADFVDVLLVAVVLSVLLGWLKRRATRPLLTAVALGMIVYGLALWQRLNLTLWLFNVSLLVLLVAALIAYQEDLRRGFERLAAGDAFRKDRGPDEVEQALATLTEAMFHFGEKCVGALFLLPGKELLDRHLRGGWVADARLSMPLLLSIFDPATPGHDGAAVIGTDGRLDRMGAHLPLSSNLEAIAGRGTRHAAALGLAERSDALVVVVSEERGEISLGREGRLDLVTSPAELSAAMAERMQIHRPQSRRSRFRLRDPEVKLAATALAILLWLAVAAPSEPVQRTYQVGIELQHVPNGWTVTTAPDQIGVMIAGPEPAVRDLPAENLRLRFDLSGLKAGVNELPVEAARLTLPDGLRATHFDPQVVSVTARPPGETAPPPPPPDVQRPYQVGIELQKVPEGWTVDAWPMQIGVTLAGPEPTVRDLKPENLRLAFDLSQVAAGRNQLPVGAATLALPDGVRVTHFDTETLLVTAKPPTEKTEEER